MTEHKHTPGPWTWDGMVWDYDREQDAPWLVTNNVESTPILSGEIKARNEADAHLIAAAPALLDALESMLEAWEYGIAEYPIAQARAALALAKE